MNKLHRVHDEPEKDLKASRVYKVQTGTDSKAISEKQDHQGRY